MVEMDYPAEQDREKFDKFYAKHITMLLTIDGFQSAQRYECTHEAKAPFLAVYRLRGPEVMTSEAYTSRAGRNSVNPTYRARMSNWDRNLAQGDIETLDLADGETMVLIDRLTADSPLLPDGFAPLEIVGLDATIAQRGVKVGNASAPAAQDGWIVRTFKPIHPVRLPE